METGASPRIRRTAVAAILCLLATLAPRAALATSDGSRGDAAPPPVTANDFVPEDRDLSECISALPKPDCGSEDRSGWRQGLVLALVLAAMAGIGARIFLAVRRRDAALAVPADERSDAFQSGGDGPVTPAR